MEKIEGINKWIKEWYDNNEASLDAFMQDLWDHPETGLNNTYAANAAYKFAETQGFNTMKLVRAGQGLKENHENPNAVIAEFGSGKPVIGIVGELDALPGLGQTRDPYRNFKEGPGQGCGHNLIAGACMGAACALRYAMEKEGIKGTLRMVEAPGEEVGRGKSLLAFDGVFKDMDMAVMWHPGPAPFSTESQHGLVVMAANFVFHGVSAHAAGKPWIGRSALDAVQLMNMGCEFLREHVTPDCRFHYQITNGGAAPNIVPDYASVKYFCRSATPEGAKDLYRRVLNCANGAATMTETQLDAGLIFQIPYFYENIALASHLNEVAQQIPDIEYTEEEKQWARDITKNYTGEEAPENINEILAEPKRDFVGLDTEHLTCTDAADMSYFCPTAHIHGGGSVACSPGHHWVITACSGTQIGMKAAVRAGKVLAEGAFEAFGSPELIEKCWEEFRSLNIMPYDELYSFEMKPEEF